MRAYIVSAPPQRRTRFSVHQALAVRDALTADSVLCDHLTDPEAIASALALGTTNVSVAHLFWPPPAGLTAALLPEAVPLVVTLGSPDVPEVVQWLDTYARNTVFAANDGAALAALRRAGLNAFLFHPALPEAAFAPPLSCARSAVRARLAPEDAIVFLFDNTFNQPPGVVPGAPGRVCTAAHDSAAWPDALAAADVFVHTAPHLTPGLAEAAARGCAIISVDSPDAASVFAGGISAVLVPAGDACALASAMRQFSLFPVLCESLGEQASLAAAEHFDATVVAEHYLDLYHEILAR